MIERLEADDEVKFDIVHDEGSTSINGVVSDRSGKYIRITVEVPGDHPNVTLVGDDEFAPALTVRRDYTWEILGTVPMLNITSGDFKTVIQAR